ncbi:MAG TPA: class I SAM-dependent methyltransferase [Atribacterota bacterium]|nr:class I SAM-dependent methyltransferase [Atribacterota bacterium]
MKNKAAEAYDKHLSLPIIKKVREQESRAINDLSEKYLGKDDNVLEIGAGTGYYSMNIALRVRSLTALEPSAAMSNILKKKITVEGAGNISIINSSLEDYKSQSNFDHVVAIGVLDYVEDWKYFLEKCLGFAEKTVIFTAPQKGMWSTICVLASRVEQKIKIYRHTKKQFENYLNDYEIQIQETALKSPLTKGMTLIVVAKKRRNTISK